MMLTSIVVDYVVADPLMVASAMIVDEKLRQRTAEVPLTQRDEMVQAFSLDRNWLAGPVYCGGEMSAGETRGWRARSRSTNTARESRPRRRVV
jgi:hypothetical protein